MVSQRCPEVKSDINPEYSLEGLMLKLQYLDTCGKQPLEKTLVLGKIEGRRRGDDRG